MKKIIIPFVAIVLLGFIAALTTYTFKFSSDDADVKVLVEKAYLHGAFNELNPEAMAQGFHKDFAIFSANGENLQRYEISDWIAGVAKRKNDPSFDPSKNVWDYKFASVNVTGGSAAVKVELSQDGKLVYTDYLSLLKFDSGWKIVAKVYTKH